MRPHTALRSAREHGAEVDRSIDSSSARMVGLEDLSTPALIEAAESEGAVLGMDGAAIVRVSAGIACEGGSNATASAGWAALFRAAEVLAAPLLLVVDGGKGPVSDGEVVRIPRRAVSPEGTSTVTGYDTVEAGLSLEVEARDVGNGRGRLRCRLERSQLIGRIEVIPTTRSQVWETEAIVESGGVYLLGSPVSDERDASSEVGLSVFRGANRTVRNVYVWARAYRIDGGIATDPSDGMLDSRVPNRKTERSP